MRISWAPRWLAVALFTGMIAVLAGCGPREPDVVVLPTQAVLPTLTPSDTPSRTPLPTWTSTLTPSNTFTNTPTETFTPSLTWTLTPSNTPTDTPTHTLTPSNTFTPTSTFTPSRTPTPTRTPTITPTLTITNTQRPTIPPPSTAVPTILGGPSPTVTIPLGPTISGFAANQASVFNGSTVVFSWTSNAQIAQLEQVTAAGVVIQSIPVPPSGQYSLVVQTVSGGGQQVFYRLTASLNGIVASSNILPIGVQCPATWFFGSPPPGTGCPTAVGAIANGAFQRFERGFMVYITANGLNRICMAQDFGAQYICVSNQWDGTTLNNTAPPSGLFAPEQQFNWSYYNTLASGGTWNGVIGWATMNIALGPRTIQFESIPGGAEGPFFIDTADGAIVRFSGGTSGTWSRIR
ncbi:MAG: hypothetical protein KME04_19920 [Pleurocapsa minor GSE-CHR-MK-17-07R]|jgi:hypothetical protein|nr:hypothetical protein [Pleurocapsa minor GSE-CHR-MK 17-07R]